MTEHLRRVLRRLFHDTAGSMAIGGSEEQPAARRSAQRATETDADAGAERQPTVSRLKLHHFEDVLPVEIDSINERRRRLHKDKHAAGEASGNDVTRLEPGRRFNVPEKVIAELQRSAAPTSPDGTDDDPAGPGTGDPGTVGPGTVGPGTVGPGTGGPRRGGPRRGGPRTGGSEGSSGGDIDPDNPDTKKMRPKPEPRKTVGLALSGGGIRSAAICLGGLQALHRSRQIDSIDYLSTVSGGGYIGASLSAAMAKDSQHNPAAFPFGEDIADNAVIGHLRNYSNYLLPRGRTAIRNYAEAAAVILRGLVANATQVIAVILLCALLTLLAYPTEDSLLKGSFIICFIDRLMENAFALLSRPYHSINATLGETPFLLTYTLLALLGIMLLLWAVLRSFIRHDAETGDTEGPYLDVSRKLIVAVVVAAFLDLQPIAIHLLIDVKGTAGGLALGPWLKTLMPVLIAVSGAVSAVSSTLGQFLKKSERSTRLPTMALRVATQFLVFVAAMALPFVLWVLYLYFVAAAIIPTPASTQTAGAIVATGAMQAGFPTISTPLGNLAIWLVYAAALLPLILVYFLLRPNNHSLHRFYRDRLSKAFIFRPMPDDKEPKPRDDLKLSALRGSNGPYPIINTAMNVQGSAEANKRGRNADFFMFTPDFIGSDLTMYGATNLAAAADMEGIDPRLDLATAMAISGAAVSANMGSNTIRLLSPTLALLNIRLGYWLRNPRDLARRPVTVRLGRKGSWLINKSYLLLEMLNLLDENSRNVYLSDGGHIENLGVYELLKRGCRTIIVFDAEADPTMSFGSLLKLERYARIDLGVRISLPWEKIAGAMRQRDTLGLSHRGPHCAVGRITYEDRAEGVLIYFKSSITGDEKDYVLDYRKRFPDFPHETTGDQFFSEEQFEAYRALGFHMVDGFFQGHDKVAFLRDPDFGFDPAEIAALRRDVAHDFPLAAQAVAMPAPVGP